MADEVGKAVWEGSRQDGVVGRVRWHRSGGRQGMVAGQPNLLGQDQHKAGGRVVVDIGINIVAPNDVCIVKVKNVLY